MKLMKRSLIFCMLTFSVLLSAAPAGRAVAETVKIAAGRSGRVLTRQAEEAAARTVAEVSAKYGDEAVGGIVRAGGLETLEQGMKYGPDFWNLCKAVPAAARPLALRADELMPYARRIGSEFLELEVRAPGLAVRAAETFGDDAVKVLAKAPPGDVTRLLGYAGKADVPETRMLLFDSYAKSRNGSDFLARLDWKRIMAGGLSAAAVTAAYKVSNGIERGLVTTAENSPETFAETVSGLTAPVRFLLYGLAGLLLLFAAAWILRFLPKRRKLDRKKE